LVEHREAVAASPPLRYRGQKYWAKPLPGFGDPNASIYIIGLAPAAHGGNRTGRIFTGDRSGDWLYSTLYELSLSNQAFSVSRDDGMQLNRVYVGAAVRCAPPGNKPLISEFENCRPYLFREFALLQGTRVILALGSIAYQAAKRLLRQDPELKAFRFPPFGHGKKIRLPGGRTLLCSYHPSQQNTFTGKLTRKMFLQVFREARNWGIDR
jgi:uracil-DNA glycosylase family 4